MSEHVPIAPDTRVAELLEAYPQLEDVLVQQAPAFKALKNPILRRTVARVATLEKAAQMGGISVRHLVSTLRQAAGLAAEAPPPAGDEPAEFGTLPHAAPLPDWLREVKVKATINADELLAAGEIPLTQAQRKLQGLQEGEILCILSSFRPAPLIEALGRSGLQTWVVQGPPGGIVHTYVCRRSRPAL